jgi:hypothetical protein
MVASVLLLFLEYNCVLCVTVLFKYSNLIGFFKDLLTQFVGWGY